MGTIIEQQIDDGLKSNYLTYAMSVIIGRAIPDVRDGLKPVHRRILYSMYEKGITSDKKTVKSAKVVGDVLGNYHPHGDAAVYDTMVRLAQDFALRYPLIHGQGNFGSIDGDPAAAMRYTECRMERLAEELVTDIDKKTVDFIPNYDNTIEEPSVLPAGFPNLLVNGTSGIAVAMSTNIPPHNLSEVILATIAYIDNPEITIEELYTKYIKAPDFPTHGEIIGLDGIRKAYKTGTGSFSIRGKANIETSKKSGKETIIITEIPYNVKKSHLIEKIAALVKEERLKGIGEIRDESSGEGIRVVLELKKNTVAEVILNQLYLHTPLQISFGIIMLAIVKGKPVLLNLKDILVHFVAHRKEVLIRSTEFDLKKANDRIHIVNGLLTAIDNLDETIKIIRGSQNTKEAKEKLTGRFGLSDIQTQSILDMRLQKLTGLERLSLENEHAELVKNIAYFQQILADEKLQYSVIKNQLAEINTRFGDKRKTSILVNVSKDIDIEDTIKPEECAVSISSEGMIKRTSLEAFRTQRRGGMGKSGSHFKDDEKVDLFIISNSLDHLLFFTDKGKVYFVKVYEIPESSTNARGKSIKTLINLDENEKIQSYLSVKEFTENVYTFFITKNGIVKKTPLMDFINARKRGIQAITMDEGDALINAIKTTGKEEIFIATAKGQGLRVSEEEIRPMGRTARGVIGIRLKGNNKVIGATLINPSLALIAVSEKGYGKRVSFEDFMAHSRGTMGQRYYSVSEQTGDVVSISSVEEESELLIITQLGMVIRTKVSEIREMGKNARGTTLMRMKDENDRIADIAIIQKISGVDENEHEK